MKKITLYWSNICILHKFEHDFLNRLKETLLTKDIELEITHFGIGYPMHLNEYLKTEGAKLPDILVSTDLEVFEDEAIFSQFKDELLPICEHFPLKEEIRNSSINRMNTLLPFLSIPLIFCSNEKGLLGNLSLKEAIDKKLGVAFGGVKNSGAKSILKAVHCAYGKEAAESLLENASITGMPIQSFQIVRMGASKLAVVPSVYTKSVDNETLFCQYPTDGAIALPSYIAARNTIELTDALTVLKNLLTEEFCNYFVSSGDIVCCLDHAMTHPLAAENNYKFLYPTNEWFTTIDQEEISALYPAG